MKPDGTKNDVDHVIVAFVVLSTAPVRSRKTLTRRTRVHVIKVPPYWILHVGLSTFNALLPVRFDTFFDDFCATATMVEFQGRTSRTYAFYRLSDSTASFFETVAHSTVASKEI